jgi:hypothetical protein
VREHRTGRLNPPVPYVISARKSREIPFQRAFQENQIPPALRPFSLLCLLEAASISFASPAGHTYVNYDIKSRKSFPLSAPVHPVRFRKSGASFFDPPAFICYVFHERMKTNVAVFFGKTGCYQNL